MNEHENNETHAADNPAFRIVGPCDEQYFEYEIYEDGSPVPLCACRIKHDAEWLVVLITKAQKERT
jgi:hypothetical protein